MRPAWSADSQSIFVRKDDENYDASYFQVELVSGKQTAIPSDRMPQLPLLPLPSGAEQPHLAQGGRFLYFQLSDQSDRSKTRIVSIRNLPPISAAK